MDDQEGIIPLREPVCDDIMHMDELQGWKCGGFASGKTKKVKWDIVVFWNDPDSCQSKALWGQEKVRKDVELICWAKRSVHLWL